MPTFGRFPSVPYDSDDFFNGIWTSNDAFNTWVTTVLVLFIQSFRYCYLAQFDPVRHQRCPA